MTNGQPLNQPGHSICTRCAVRPAQKLAESAKWRIYPTALQKPVILGKEGVEMNKPMRFFQGAALGAGLMYLLDPDRGKRRRSMLRDACVRLSNETQDALDVTRRDLTNRLHGFKAEINSLFQRSASAPPDDDQLLARIRSHLGRVASHPRALEIECHDGRVVLRGPVLAAEAQRIFDCVRSVRGVQHVENQMEMHEEAGNISALQGGIARPGAQWDIMQDRWSPSTRMLVGAGAASLLACASGRAAAVGALGILGVSLMTVSPARGSQTRGRQRQSQRGGGQRATGQQRATGRQRGRRFEIGGLSDRGGFDVREEQTGMKVSDIMTPSPATCHGDTNLKEVARMMLQCDCGAIPIVHPGTNEPIGIITDRDITIRTVAEGRNPTELKASDCMTSPVETISSEASLDECTDKMEASQVRRMIVVDQDNRICGIVAQADVAMYAPKEETAELVQDVSAPAPVPTI